MDLYFHPPLYLRELYMYDFSLIIYRCRNGYVPLFSALQNTNQEGRKP